MNRPDRGERPRRGAARTRRCTQSMHPRPRPRPSGGPASRGWGSSAWASTNRRTEYRPSYGAVLKKLPSRADFCGGNADCPRSTRAPVLRPRTGSRNVATGYSRASEDSRLARPLRQGRGRFTWRFSLGSNASRRLWRWSCCPPPRIPQKQPVPHRVPGRPAGVLVPDLLALCPPLFPAPRNSPASASDIWVRQTRPMIPAVKQPAAFAQCFPSGRTFEREFQWTPRLLKKSPKLYKAPLSLKIPFIHS